MFVIVIVLRVKLGMTGNARVSEVAYCMRDGDIGGHVETSLAMIRHIPCTGPTVLRLIAAVLEGPLALLPSLTWFETCREVMSNDEGSYPPRWIVWQKTALYTWLTSVPLATNTFA